MRIPHTKPGAAGAAGQTPEQRKLLRAIYNKQREVQMVEEQLEKAADLSAPSIKVLQNLKAAHEAALAKLLEAAPEKITAKGEAE